jgi:hypothetical protein
MVMVMVLDDRCGVAGRVVVLKRLVVRIGDESGLGADVGYWVRSYPAHTPLRDT